MPRRNSPPTSTAPGSAPGSDMTESDFVILPRPSLDNINNMPGTNQADLQLQSQLSPTSSSVVNGGTNVVATMQYDLLVTAARSMKEENHMLRGQLTEMMQTMDVRTEDFLKVKSCNRLVTERCNEIRKAASLEVTKLHNQIKSLVKQLEQGSQNQDETTNLQARNKELEEKLNLYQTRIRQLETELKEKTEEVVVSFESGASYAAGDVTSDKTPVSLLTQLKEDIKVVQGTRADIKTNVADLEVALLKSAADLRHFKQQADLLKLEKQDLLALNNELQTKVSIYSSGGYQEVSRSQMVAAVGSDVAACNDAIQGAAEDTKTLPQTPFSPRQAMQKSNIALQDVLLQLQAERDKVSCLMEDLKKERGDKNKIETTLMKQLHTRSGEHNIALEELTNRHGEQVKELVMKLDELTVANQEPHHSMELKHQVTSLVCELQERENVLQQKEHSVADLRSLNEALKSKIALYHDELEEVRKQDSRMIETLRLELQRQQTMSQLEKQKALMERINHEKMKEEYNQLFADYDDLNRKYEDLRARHGQAVNATDFRELAEKRDNLIAQVMSAEEAIGVKDEQLEKAQRELQTAKTALETIPVLEAQAEIFKNDFDAERAAREKAHTEREALMAELQTIKEDNQRMQGELESHANTQLQQMQHRHGHGSSSSSSNNPFGGSGGIYERYINPMFNTTSHNRGYGGEYGQGMGSDDTFVMAEAGDIGVDVDQIRGSGLDESGTGVISPGNAGHDPNQAKNVGHSPRTITNPKCPKCQNGFPDIDTLQIHMLDCIK